MPFLKFFVPSLPPKKLFQNYKNIKIFEASFIGGITTEKIIPQFLSTILSIFGGGRVVESYKF
jgi:hypothetical protein